MGKWVMPLKISATLLLAAALMNIAFGLLQLHEGVSAGSVTFAGAGPIALASLLWVWAMLAKSKNTGAP